MCGIVGIFERRKSPRREQLAAMLARVAARGPDDSGYVFDGACALGHARLAIIDLAEHAAQPMVSDDQQLSIVFNGTIYNHHELRRQLQGLGRYFRSHSDTEVILQAFAEWGEDCVTRLSGVFAFAIWDGRRERLFLARDRLGIKPLYFAQDQHGFLFASNPQALLASGRCDVSIDPAALHHAFTLHGVVPAPRTVLAGINKCLPAHSMTVERSGEVSTHCYWTLPARRPAIKHSDGEWREMVEAALIDAVTKRSEISDVPVGVLLSGGLDSSLLIALLAETGTQSLNTYSIGFEHSAEEEGDEFAYSDRVADYFGTQHHKIVISNTQVLQRLPATIEAMAEPMFGQDAVAFHLLSEQVGRDMKVVQSGQGADEVFAGYFWYPRMLATPGTRLQRFASHYFDRDHAEYLATVSADFHTEDVTSKWIAETLKNAQGETFMDAVLHLDVTTLVVDDPVKRVDNMAMAHGVDARVPFLDQRVVELAAACPPELKLLQQGKGILKQIARGRLPDAIIDRPKAYFPLPALKYIRGDFLDFMADTLNSQACRERGVFSRDMISKLLAQPDQYLTRLNSSKLWQCAVFEYWMQKNVG